MASPLQELVSQLPALMMQYRMAEERNSLDTARMEMQQELSLNQALLGHQQRQFDIKSGEYDRLSSEFADVSSDIYKIAGPASSLVPELHQTKVYPSWINK